MILLLFSCSIRSDSLRTHGLQHARLHCPTPSLGKVMPSNHPILCCPLVLLSSVFPSIRSTVTVAQLCPTLCDPMDYGILQARILELVAFPFSRGSSPPRNQTGVSRKQELDSFPTDLSGEPGVPTSGSFLMSWLFASGGQSIGASASASERRHSSLSLSPPLFVYSQILSFS